MRVTGISEEKDGTIYMVPGSGRNLMICAGAARALEDAIKELPPESAPLRRVSFEITLEYRAAEGESPARVVVMESTLSVQKARACTVIRNA